jgi:hypothetical protein
MFNNNILPNNKLYNLNNNQNFITTDFNTRNLISAKTEANSTTDLFSFASGSPEEQTGINVKTF